MTNTELAKELERLQQENAALKARAAQKVTFKITVPRAAGTNGPTDKGSPGGGLSVYGLGRFPWSGYKNQWLTLLSVAEALKQFIKDHDAELTVKA